MKFIVKSDTKYLDAEPDAENPLSVNADGWDETLLPSAYATLHNSSLTSALESAISDVRKERNDAEKLQAQQKRDKANPIRRTWEMPPTSSFSGPSTSGNLTRAFLVGDGSVGHTAIVASQVVKTVDPTLNNTLPGSHQTN